MLRILLVLSAICHVNSQLNCLLSNYTNNVGLKNQLNGTYYVIYTSAIVLNCEQGTWTTGTDNTLSADIQSTGCCMRIRNFDASNAAQFSYTVSPVSPGCALTSTENATMKLITTTVYLGKTCLIIGICRQSRQGFLVLCRNRTQPDTLLTFVNLLLTTLLGQLVAPQFQKVNQVGCLGNNECIS